MANHRRAKRKQTDSILQSQACHLQEVGGGRWTVAIHLVTESAIELSHHDNGVFSRICPVPGVSDLNRPR